MKRLVRRAELIQAVGISKSEIDRLERQGRFPRRIALSPRCTAWSWDEVQAWIAARIAERGQSRIERQRAETGKRLTRSKSLGGATT